MAEKKKEPENRLKVVAATYELPVEAACTRVLAIVDAHGRTVRLGPENIYSSDGAIDPDYELDLSAAELDELIEALGELRGLMKD